MKLVCHGANRVQLFVSLVFSSLTGGSATMRKRAAGIGLALLAVGTLIGQVGIASASGTNQSTLVNASPSAKTPNISDGVVYAIAEVGSRIIVGGSFTKATPPGETTTTHQ